MTIDFPSDEDIVRWSNEMADLHDDRKEYTATGSRIAVHERCVGARWMLDEIKKRLTPQQKLFV